MSRFVALALGLGLALLAGCGGEENPGEAWGATGEGTPVLPAPTTALQSLYDALAAGDVTRAHGMMLPVSDAALSARLEEDLGQTVELLVGGELTLTAHEHKVQGDWAVVVTRHALERGGERQVLIRDEFLYRTPEGWRAAFEPMRADPAIRPLWEKHGDATELLNWFRAQHQEFVAKYR